jgi:nucleoside-diphosphate-sugar epimerase
MVGSHAHSRHRRRRATKSYFSASNSTSATLLLKAHGHEVVCLDNLFTGRKANIAHLLGNPSFEFVRHDVIDPFKFEVDQIYNLACPASPPHYQYNPIKTIKTSVMGAINCLGLAKRVKARVFQASTSEVYGDPQVHPQPESYWGNVNPIGKRSCYDEGKRCAETLFFDYHRENKVDIRVVRIFNTYGPRMHPNDGRVVSNFIVQALKGEDITIYGDGIADALVLLRGRPDRGLRALHGADRDGRPDEPRQPRRVHDAAARRAHAEAGRRQIEDRPQAAAGRRPEAAPARHHARARNTSSGSRRCRSRKA